MAEASLLETVKSPHNIQFNSTQRQATCDAARIAKLEPILVNEVVAAYLFEFKTELCVGTKNLLIFDFGGGRTDATIITSNDGLLEIRSNVGNMNCGGDDVDWVLIDRFRSDYYINNGQDITTSASGFHRLREACEQLKKQLSFSTKAHIKIEELHGYKDFSSSLERDRFEYMCQPLFEEALKCVTSAMEEAQLRKDEIDEVILVGGSSRIPKIQKMLSDYFNGITLNKAINPDEAVAIGAAVYSMVIRNPQAAHGLAAKIQIPFNIGFEVCKGLMEPKNAILPTSAKAYYGSCKAKATYLIEFYEGSNVHTCKLLSSRVPLQLNADKRLSYRTTLEVDVHQTLKITVVDLVSKRKFCINEEAKFSLENCIQQIREESGNSDIIDDAKRKIQVKCDHVENWLNSVPEATSAM